MEGPSPNIQPSTKISLDRINSGLKKIDNVMCKSCKHVVDLNGTQTCSTCGKSNYCAECGDKLSKENKPCVGCKNEFKPVHPPQNIIDELNQLTIFCQFQELGCDQVFKLSQIREHEKDCPFDFVVCVDGCKKKMLRKEFPKHSDVCKEIEFCCPRCDYEGKKNSEEHDCRTLRFAKYYETWPEDEKTKFIDELLAIMKQKVEEETDPVKRAEAQKIYDQTVEKMNDIPEFEAI
jgi:hypothetical protein